MSGLENVEKVEIDFEKKTATVSMKENGALTKEAVEKALKDKGFGVDKFEKKDGAAPAGDAVYMAEISGMK